MAYSNGELFIYVMENFFPNANAGRGVRVAIIWVQQAENTAKRGDGINWLRRWKFCRFGDADKKISLEFCGVTTADADIVGAHVHKLGPDGRPLNDGDMYVVPLPRNFNSSGDMTPVEVNEREVIPEVKLKDLKI